MHNNIPEFLSPFEQLCEVDDEGKERRHSVLASEL